MHLQRVQWTTLPRPTTHKNGSISTCVKPRVNDHLVSLREGLGAVLAGVRPRVGVDPLVLAHQVATLEALGTEGALIRPFASVHDPVLKKT